MRELQRKQEIRRAIYSAPSLVVLLVITFLLAKGAWGVISKERESAANLEGLAEKSLALAIREQELKDEISRLQTDEGVKEEIKERFNVTQEGEYVALIVDDKRSASSTDKSGKAWYKRFFYAIIGK